jgi:glycosyltransferase involved in cell wall biosynthesis
LLLAALEKLQGQLPSLELVVFGQSRPSVIPELGFPIHYMGQLHDDLSLRLLYSAADAMVIPSRQDNLPNTGLEALACGTPVVAFNIGGLPDIVCHQQTGWLSNAFDTSDLARGIQWVLEDGLRLARLGQQSRAYAEKHFAESDIAQCYQQLYDQLLSYPNAASGIKFHNI